MALDSKTLATILKMAARADDTRIDAPERETATYFLVKTLKDRAVSWTELLEAPAQLVDLAARNEELAEAATLLQEEVGDLEKRLKAAGTASPQAGASQSGHAAANAIREAQKYKLLADEWERRACAAEKNNDTLENQCVNLSTALRQAQKAHQDIIDQGIQYLNGLRQASGPSPQPANASLKSIFASMAQTHSFFDKIRQQCESACQVIALMTENRIVPSVHIQDTNRFGGIFGGIQNRDARLIFIVAREAARVGAYKKFNLLCHDRLTYQFAPDCNTDLETQLGKGGLRIENNHVVLSTSLAMLKREWPLDPEVAIGRMMNGIVSDLLQPQEKSRLMPTLQSLGLT